MRKGVKLDNLNEIHVEYDDEKGFTHIFRGSGAALPNGAEYTEVDGVRYKPHSHTMIDKSNQVVYDRDEYGNEFTNSLEGKTPSAPVPSAFTFAQEQSIPPIQIENTPSSTNAQSPVKTNQPSQQQIDVDNDEEQAYGY